MVGSLLLSNVILLYSSVRNARVVLQGTGAIVLPNRSCFPIRLNCAIAIHQRCDRSKGEQRQTANCCQTGIDVLSKLNFSIMSAYNCSKRTKLFGKLLTLSEVL